MVYGNANIILWVKQLLYSLLKFSFIIFIYLFNDIALLVKHVKLNNHENMITSKHIKIINIKLISKFNNFFSYIFEFPFWIHTSAFLLNNI